MLNAPTSYEGTHSQDVLSAPALVRTYKRIRAVGTCWIADPSLKHLEAIRVAELQQAMTFFPSGGKILDLGAGTGWQTKLLATKGFDAVGVDLPGTFYSQERVWPIIDYNGRELPFEDATFDVVFSSNTLEHIPHVREFQTEIQRVLKPNGIAVHVVPTSWWTLWSSITHMLKWWKIPAPHGHQAKSVVTEMLFYFSRTFWTQLFTETGWTVSSHQPNRLFYTGDSIFDSRLTLTARRYLSGVLGSSCRIFVLKNATIDTPCPRKMRQFDAWEAREKKMAIG
jgi:SAM-dependent methyltransferase